MIVVDDASSDGTERWFKRKKWNFTIRYVRNKVNKGRAGARNVGLRKANGDIIILCDSDMIVPPDFIQRHVNHHLNNDRLVVCGSFWNPIYTHLYRNAERDLNNKVKKIIGKNPILLKKFSLARKKLMTRRFARLISLKDIPKIAQSKLISSSSPITHYFTPYTNAVDNETDKYSFVWICFVVMNVSVRRKYLKPIEYFDKKFVGYGGEDTDVGYRLWKKGLQFVVDPELKNYHQEHPRVFTIQESERKKNKVYLAQKHQTTEMVMQLYIRVGNDLEKSQFLLDRDRLLSKGLISVRWVNQLDWLIWIIAHADSPHFGDKLKSLEPIDPLFFWAEVNKINDLQQYSSFVTYVKNLYHYANIKG